MTPPTETAWESPESIFRDTVEELLDTPPQILLDLRFAELEAARVAADQVLVELVANARDAALRGPPEEVPRIRIGLFAGSLWVANDGIPLGREGYLALKRIARSSKRGAPDPAALGLAPGKPFSPLTLGRHGVGFRSVLAVCDGPRIYGRSADGRPFGLGFGEARLRQLSQAALDGDVEACAAALPPEEAAWLHGVLRGLPLEARSLTRHAGRAGISGGELAAGLPVLPFPLAVPPAEAPGAIAEALGWRESRERPFTTVVELPLRRTELERLLDAIEAQLPAAERCVMGTRIQLTLAG